MRSARAHGRASSRRSSRRRRRSFLFAGGSTMAALATAFSVTNFAGVDLASAAVERAKSFLQLMSQRSPGERVKGELIKTKHKKYQVLAEREGPVMPSPPLTESLVDVLAPPAALLPGGIETSELGLPTGLPPGIIPLPPPGIIVVPCCAVVPPPPPPPPPPGPPPPPPPPP
ncbi:MAG: hypothetical protein ABI454_04645, partial [Sphingomicrobium sp.]